MRRPAWLLRMLSPRVLPVFQDPNPDPFERVSLWLDRQAFRDLVGAASHASCEAPSSAARARAVA